MQHLSLILFFALVCGVCWMSSDSFAVEAQPEGAREVSTANEHYWVVDVNGVEKKHGPYNRLHTDGSNWFQGTISTEKKTVNGYTAPRPVRFSKRRIGQRVKRMDVGWNGMPTAKGF